MDYVMIILYFAIIIALIASIWKVFVKAGKPGWAAIVPIYNIIVMLEIVGKPLWWIVLMFIPIANFVVAIIIAMEMAERFGKSKGWGVIFLVFLGFIGYPILGFGDAQYSAPSQA